MSRDGLLPRGLASTGSHGTPVRIMVLVAVLIAVAASLFPMSKLEEMVNVGTLFAFVLVSAGVIVLRRTRPDLQRGFRAPFVPVLPVLSIIACLWLMLNLTGLTWIRFAIWMLVGIVVYALYGYRHSVLGQSSEVIWGANNGVNSRARLVLARDSILDAMREELLTQDWSAVTLADIARTAGVSRQTIYNEFGSRQGAGAGLRTAVGGSAGRRRGRRHRGATRAMCSRRFWPASAVSSGSRRLIRW